MRDHMSAMAQETREAPSTVTKCLRENEANMAELVKLFRRINPSHIITCARGSSDHAAGYFKYLSEIVLGIPCCSVGASIASVYESKLRFRDTLLLTISQSGASPDIVAMQTMAKKVGIPTISITNHPDSPLGQVSDICLPLFAGVEKSVAATKTFVTSAALVANIVASLADDAQLSESLARLPDVLSAAQDMQWNEIESVLLNSRSAYLVGRGPALPIALEAALKLKETCAIHAEGYSAAEIMHGPMELVSKGFPVIAFASSDASQDPTLATVHRLREAGATVLTPNYIRTDSPLLDPISMIQSFYVCVEQLARSLGRDPDRPRLLQKVTATI